MNKGRGSRRSFAWVPWRFCVLYLEPVVAPLTRWSDALRMAVRATLSREPVLDRLIINGD
jgi:hypothetical protein